jgi:hypothetical protein
MELEMDKCHYCGSFTTNKNNNYYTKTLYGVTKSHLIRGMGYSYIEKKVTIYRCENCYDKHGKHFLLTDLPTIIISYAIFFWVFNYKYGSGNINVMSVLLPLIPMMLVWWIVTPILRYFLSLVSKTGKFENDIEDFEEVKKLLELGWLMNKPPKGADITDKDLIKTEVEKE